MQFICEIEMCSWEVNNKNSEGGKNSEWAIKNKNSEDWKKFGTRTAKIVLQISVAVRLHLTIFDLIQDGIQSQYLVHKSFGTRRTVQQRHEA